MTSNPNQLPGVEITGIASQQAEILTPEALQFVVDLERRFGPKRRELLAAREPFYRQADVLLNTELRSVREVAQQVVHQFRLEASRRR